MEQNDEKKNIEIISGNGTDLDISPVYNHIPISKPNTEKKDTKNIVIPTEKKKNRRKGNK